MQGGNKKTARWLPRAAAIAALAAVYFLSAKVGLSLAFLNENATTVWPPTGIALAAVALFGYRLWPGIFLGAFLANWSIDGSVVTSFLIASGNTMEALFGAFLLYRFAGGRRPFDRPKHLFYFVVLTGMASTAVSATVGVASLLSGGFASPEDYKLVWLTWWLGDMISNLTVAPLLIIWFGRPLPALKLRRLMEAALLFLSIFLVGQLVFGGWLPPAVRNYPLEYLEIPLLLWAAFRFGRHGASAAAFALSIIATRGTLAGYGPFALEDPNRSLLLLQAFMGTFALTALVLASVLFERNQAEAERSALGSRIEAQGRRLSNLVGTVPGVVWEAWGDPDDGSQRINFVSDYIETMLGYRVDEWLATPNFWLTIVHPDDRERAAREASEIFSGGKGGVIQFRWMTKGGEAVWVEARAVGIRNEAGEPIGIRGVTMDITQRIAAEEELKRKTLEAEEASRVKSQFVSNVSHELRTPLNSVIGYAHLLLEGSYGALGERQIPPLERVLRNADELLYLITNLLDLSKIGSGKMALELGKVDLPLLLQEILTGLKPIIEKKPLSVRWSKDASIPPIESDENKIRQILVNLLSNALKFTREGEITIEMRNLPAREGVEVGIRDTGIGIPDEALPKIFDAFHQVDASVTREFGGTGLGLAIVKELTEVLNGEIRVESRAGEGSTFTLFLPYRLPATTR